MRFLILAVTMALSVFAGTAEAQSVLKTKSGICHCPGGAYYDGITNFTSYPDLQSCLATGAREPKKGQGDCSRSGAVTAQSTPADAAPQVIERREAAPSLSGKKYDRDAFGNGWSDLDRNCMNTRHEILRATSTGNTILSKNGCSVTHGRWNDPYTGKIFTNPRDMDIDHIVPLSYAWQRGADTWTPKDREMFANDPVNLIAVDAPTNRQKSDSGPLKWLPPNVEYRCQYILRFIRISKSYNLILSPEEERDMGELSAHLCG